MISAIVLTQNDEKNIGRTLTSLAWCDEIIVIDDNSTDGTVAFAKKRGATVYQRALKDDFAGQRNFGLTKAKGDWVLFIDSDEVVTNELAEEIRRAIAVIPALEPGSSVQKGGIPSQARLAESKRARNDKMYVGFYLKRQDVLWGRELKYGETGKVRLLRLAKKNGGTWERPVHEAWNLSGVVGILENPIRHFPHPNVAQFIKDINHYSTINAQYLYTQKIRAPGWHIIAYPKAKFFQNYFLRLGFLDGTAGAVVALVMSFHSFLTRAKLWLLWHKKEAVSV